MPISCKLKGGGYASGGLPFKKLLTSAAPFYAVPQSRLCRHESLRMQWSRTMDPTNIGLWLILIATIALIPCGCIMTRPRVKQKGAPSTTPNTN